VVKWLENTYQAVRALVYLDDFLVVAKSKDEAMLGMFVLVRKLEEIGVKINIDKTVAMPVQQIDWLGMHLSNHTLRVTAQKKAAIVMAWC